MAYSANAGGFKPMRRIKHTTTVEDANGDGIPDSSQGGGGKDPSGAPGGGMMPGGGGMGNFLSNLIHPAFRKQGAPGMLMPGMPPSMNAFDRTGGQPETGGLRMPPGGFDPSGGGFSPPPFDPSGGQTGGLRLPPGGFDPRKLRGIPPFLMPFFQRMFQR
jgi:hypothetical protein